MQPCPVLRLPVTQQWKRNGTTHFTFSQRVYQGGLKVLRDFLTAREFTSYTQCRLELAVYRKSLINIFRNQDARVSPWFDFYSWATGGLKVLKCVNMEITNNRGFFLIAPGSIHVSFCQCKLILILSWTKIKVNLDRNGHLIETASGSLYCKETTI